MAVDEDMAYGFVPEPFFCGSPDNGFPLMGKDPVPCNTLYQRLRISPSAQFPRLNPEYPAGSFLG